MDERTAYERLKSRPKNEGFANRDVYEDQQFDRGELQGKKSAVPWLVGAGVISFIVFIIAWFFISLFNYGKANIIMSNKKPIGQTQTQTQTKLTYDPNNAQNYIKSESKIDPMTGMKTKYAAVDENGNVISDWHESVFDVPQPDWYKTSKTEYEQTHKDKPQEKPKKEVKKTSFGYHFKKISLMKFILAFGAAGMVYSILKALFMRNLEAQNMLADTSDINQYKNDQHVMLPEEMFENPEFDFFPDVGCHSSVQVSTLISHIALQNKGIDPVMISKKYDKDEFDEDGNLIYEKHEIMTDDDGNVIYESKPKIDEKFMNELYNTSGVTDKSLMRFFDPRKINYNPGNSIRERMKGFDTLADVINKDWELPYYEHQRPAGAYVVDTSPVNSMILAITRAGKG